MPIYEYIVKESEQGCEYCQPGFEVVQAITDEAITHCTKCGAAIRRVFPNITIGPSKTGFDRKAKDSGFHKLKKVDKGKYEKLY